MVERSIYTIISIIQLVMAKKQLIKSFWKEIAAAMVYI